jgi:hypothetical protein
MSGRPSLIQQREAKQIIKAARQAGAKQVEVKYPNGVAVVVHLDVEDEKPAADANEWLTDDASSA